MWLLIKELVRSFFRSPQKVTQAKPIIHPDEVSIWYIGHATMLINFYGTTILTDPVFISWLPPRRLVQAGTIISDLPEIDILVMSHAHLDHWQKGDLKKIAGKVKHMIIPRNCMDRVPENLKAKAQELDWQTTTSLDDVTVHAFEAHHWGEVYPWEYKNRGYNMYIFEKGKHQLFFSGDTAMTSMFQKIGEQFKNIEMALLPIGAYEPREYLKNVHMAPDEAIQALIMLNAQHMIPYHFDTFRLSFEKFGQAPRELLEHAEKFQVKEKVHVLTAGESFGFRE